MLRRHWAQAFFAGRDVRMRRVVVSCKSQEPRKGAPGERVPHVALIVIVLSAKKGHQRAYCTEVNCRTHGDFASKAEQLND